MRSEGSAMRMSTATPRRELVDVRHGGERAKTRISWLDSKHSFSFGRHWDPANTHHGLLLVNNDDIVTPGAGFETHPHRDMEIVTWVLEGSLVHQDSEGNTGVIFPGLAQRMSAGTGILHSEKNDAWRVQGGPGHDEPVRFVQMWVVPDEPGGRPGYEQQEIDDQHLRSGLVPVASGRPAHAGDAAIRIANRDAALHAARLQAEENMASRARSTRGGNTKRKAPVQKKTQKKKKSANRIKDEDDSDIASGSGAEKKSPKRTGGFHASPPRTLQCNHELTVSTEADESLHSPSRPPRRDPGMLTLLVTYNAFSRS